MQLGDDLTHGGHTALALQTLRYNGIISIREINWSLGVKDSEQGGGGGLGEDTRDLKGSTSHHCPGLYQRESEAQRERLTYSWSHSKSLAKLGTGSQSQARGSRLCGARVIRLLG